MTSLCGMRVGQVEEPSRTVAFTDSSAVRNKTKVTGTPWVYPYWSVTGSANLQSVKPKNTVNSSGCNVHFRHGGSASVSWADGHVSFERPSYLSNAPWARTALIGDFGPMDNSLYDPWNL